MAGSFGVMVRAACLALLAVAVPAVAAAQMTRGGLVGTVRDASGGVIPGVTVTVTNMDTNNVRVAVTDENGLYRVQALEPGRYTISTELQGFTKVEQRDVRVQAAMDTTIDVTLRPGGLTETVSVMADTANIGLNRTNPTIGTTISARAVEELPLPGGRNINNLVLTTPNASSTTGQGTFAINGNRPRNNNYMVDGSDNNDISVTISTSQIIPESVAEFQVLQNPYSVEFGRNSGGQINVITKSGTNRVSGDIFDYYQSAGLNSLNNLEKDSGLTDPSKFIRHQVGGDLGGPIFRDRLFFFGAYQRDSQATALRPSPTTVTIPTQAGFAALQNVPLRPGQPASSRQAVLDSLGFLQDVYAANPVFKGLSSTLVNGVPIETGVANLPLQDPSLYHYVNGRLDFRPWANDTFTARAIVNDRVDEGVAALGFGNRFMANQDILDTNWNLSNTHVFGAALLNESRFSLVRRDLAFPENDPNSPTGTITGLFQIGGAVNFPQGRLSNSYQFTNTLTWNLAKHSLKIGGDVRYNDMHQESGFYTKGWFTFNNLEDYMNNVSSQAVQALQTASFDATQWQSAFFVQDDFRVTPDLTLNLGLRYELAEMPLGMMGATDPESLAAGVPGPVTADKNNWAPRAGFAWSPSANNWLLGDRQTVIRGGFGIAYDVIFFNLLQVNANNYPRVNTLIESNVTDVYPSRLQGSADVTFSALNGYVNAQQGTESPEQRFYSLSLQRELGRRFLVEVGYSGSRGYKGINQVEMNPSILTEAQAAQVIAAGSATAIPGLQARRVDPAIGSRVLIPALTGPAGNDAEARSRYNAVYVSGTHRLTNGVQFNASYTFSRWESNNDASLAEGGTDGTSQRPQSMFDYDAEWSVSQFDRPHRFTASYLWEIPGPTSGILGTILGGWQLSGVTQAQSGRPFTIWTGVDSNGDSNGGSDRPNIDPAGTFVWDEDRRHFTNNGYYVTPIGNNGLPLANSVPNGGNAPRNSERAAGFWNTDLSLAKRFTLTNRVRFTARIDAFNAFNQDSYGIPNLNMSSPNFGLNTNNWGRRTLQLAGKFSF
jgi:hypothetical protein